MQQATSNTNEYVQRARVTQYTYEYTGGVLVICVRICCIIHIGFGRVGSSFILDFVKPHSNVLRFKICTISRQNVEAKNFEHLCRPGCTLHSVRAQTRPRCQMPEYIIQAHGYVTDCRHVHNNCTIAAVQWRIPIGHGNDPMYNCTSVPTYVYVTRYVR